MTLLTEQKWQREYPRRSERLKQRRMAQKSTANFSHLPAEIILKIFSYIPVSNLIRKVSLVSKQFYSLSTDRSLALLNISMDIDVEQITPAPQIGRYQQMDSFELSFKTPEFFDKDHFIYVELYEGADKDYLAKLADHVLRLAYNSPLSQDFFADIFQYQIGLKTLKLFIDEEIFSYGEYHTEIWSKSPSPETTCQIARMNLLKGISNCKQLEHLDLHFKSVCFEELKEVATLSQLKELIINVSPEITPLKFHEGLSKADWNQLTNLTIHFETADDSCLSALVTSCPNIHQANLFPRTSEITSQGITAFLAGCMELRRLMLNNCTLSNLTPPYVEHFHGQWEDLKEWSYWDCDEKRRVFHHFDREMSDYVPDPNRSDHSDDDYVPDPYRSDHSDDDYDEHSML